MRLRRRAALTVVSRRRRPPTVAVPRHHVRHVSSAAVPQSKRRVAASAIDPTYPVFGTPTTITVRNNFQAAKDEIEELQAGKLDLAGGTMTGPIVLVPAQLIDGGVF